MARKLITHEESMRGGENARTYAIHSDSYQEEPDVTELGELLRKVLRGVEANEGSTTKVLGLRVSTFHATDIPSAQRSGKPYRHEVEVRVTPAWEEDEGE